MSGASLPADAGDFDDDNFYEDFDGVLYKFYLIQRETNHSTEGQTNLEDFGFPVF